MGFGCGWSAAPTNHTQKIPFPPLAAESGRGFHKASDFVKAVEYKRRGVCGMAKQC